MKDVKLQGTSSHSHSWWWDSHVSPRHSKWLKENLEDMDIKVKDMLTLIEEDAESFAKRAEMYYKKRPELISLVEGFYRAYRALAERYDHISGELHHAQCSMGDALPIQPHNGMDSISPRDSLLNRPSQFNTMKELEEFEGVMEDTDNEYMKNKDTVYASACLKEMENQSLNAKNEPAKSAQLLEPQSDFNKLIKLQKEISCLYQERQILKREHEKGAQEFRVMEEQLLQMQEELHHVQEESHKLIETSSLHVARINELEEQLSMLIKQSSEHIEETEVLRHKLQFETQENKKLIMEIQSLEIKLSKAEGQTTQTEANHACSSPDHGNKGKKFSNLQDENFKLHHDNHSLRMQVMTGVQQLQSVNDEIQKLHQALLKSQTENDTMIMQYQQSLRLYESAENRARDLQIKMALVQEENRRIKDEMTGGALRTKITEGGQNLGRETYSFQPNYWHQIQQTDFSRLRGKQDVEHNPGMNILDEASQVLDFDTFLKNCQQSLSQSQEQQNKLSEELQKGNERLKNAENKIKFLEEENSILHRENDNVMQKSSSAVVMVKNLEQDVYKLKQEKNNLLNEVAFRVDQRDALQQELYCLKEDRNDLDRKFQVIIKQIELLGLDAASLNTVTISLENTRQKLRDYGQIGDDENASIPQILVKTEELLQKIEILENSVISHQVGADRFQFAINLLEKHIDGLQKEKAELMDESKRWNSQIRDLEAKLHDVNNLYSQLHRESQQNKNELADAMGCMKLLEEQRCSLQGEKEALRKEIGECTLQMSYSQKQIDLREKEVEDLRYRIEKETNKGQILETEIRKLQKVICEIENRNQTLSDDYDRLRENYGAAMKKVKEQEEINSKQKIENDMLFHKISSADKFKRDLELEIENLQMLLCIPYKVEEKIGNAGGDGTDILRSIVGEVKSLQKELSHLQEENEMFLNDSLTKTTHLEQLQKDISVLCSEKESIRKEAALALDNLLCLQQEKSHLQEEIRLLHMKLKATLESDKILNSEILSLQQSWTSSVSECLASECNYQTLLQEYSSTKACLRDSECKLLELEQENQILLIEALSQVSLLSVLESMIIENNVHMQLMGEQINNFQNKDANLQYWPQNCCLQPHIQEDEILTDQELICGFQKEEEKLVYGASNMVNGLDEKSDLHDQKVPDEDKGRDESLGKFCQEAAVQHRYRQMLKSFSSIQPDCETLETRENEFQQKVSVMTEDKLKVDGFLDKINGEQQREDDKVMCSTSQTRGSSEISEELQEKIRKHRKERDNVHDLAVSSKKIHKSPRSSPSMRYIEDEQCEQSEYYDNRKVTARECNEGIVSLENDRGKQVEALKAADNRESEAVYNALEDGKTMTEAKVSPDLLSSRKEDMCPFREEGTNILSRMEAQKTNIQKWQGHWRRRFHADVRNFQQGETGVNHEVETPAQNMLKRQSDIPAIYLFTNEKEEMSQPLKDGCQYRIKELCDDETSSEHIENNNVQMEEKCKTLQFHKERMPIDDFPSQLSNADLLNIKTGEQKGLETRLETKSKEMLPAPEVVHGTKAKSEAYDPQSQISKLQNLVRDVQQKNNELKFPGLKNSAVCSIMGKDHLEIAKKNAKFMLEGPSDVQEEKEVLLEEVWSTQSFQEKVKYDMYYHLQEQNQKLWTRLDSATQQMQKLQITFQELQEKLWKTRKDNKKSKVDGQTETENNAIEKQFRELQDELILWLECNDMLTKEAQKKFAFANRLQAELAAEGGQLTEESEDTELVFGQGENAQKELLSIQEQTSKIADLLRAGSDKARGLEFEVEKILLKFQGNTKISISERHKKAYIPRVRTSLRVFLFGKEEHRQKQPVGWACMQSVTNE